MPKKTSVTKRQLLKGDSTVIAAAVPGVAAATAPIPLLAPPSLSDITPGPFKPTWESLAADYRVPDWFRDAKFGIWAHWSAQCVPEQGDWYARNMYIQGNKQYDHHLKTYGHPVDTGFMEIDNLWKAENWNPDELLDLYVKAGAKYFVALANHHDNFDNYDSKFHDWNSTKVGPKKDLIAGWAKAARKRGLKFGVSNHSSHAWHWFQTAYGYDPEGPRAGQRYDAARLTKADGKGKWWDGLDPQELYVGASIPLPYGLKTIAEAAAWNNENNRKILDPNIPRFGEIPPPAHPEFTRQWFLRCKDLIDSYQPDLLYFDNSHLPLGQAGLDAAAHYYNAGLKWHGGKQEVVINTKDLEPDIQPAVVYDIERGSLAEASPYPWQTDTCIGQWHYSREVFETKSYKSAALVVHTLCNIVSKNGNLLLSVPLRGDGTIDSEERKIVEGIADWMSRFSDAIYDTRPWRVAGEGPTQVAASDIGGEGKQKPYTAADIRFTAKKGALYAITLGRPDSETVTIASLAIGGKYAAGQIKRVEVLGAQKPLTFTRDDKGLHISLPRALSHDIGVAFKITSDGIA
jgi:alpha-L-fucosidase